MILLHSAISFNLTIYLVNILASVSVVVLSLCECSAHLQSFCSPTGGKKCLNRQIKVSTSKKDLKIALAVITFHYWCSLNQIVPPSFLISTDLYF